MDTAGTTELLPGAMVDVLEFEDANLKAEREAAETVEATDTTYIDDAAVVENESEERQEAPLTVGDKVVEESAATQSAL